MKSDLFECHRIARGLLHSRSAFGIGLPLTATNRRHLGCGCSSVVEHDLAKVGVEGSSPFARSRFFPARRRQSKPLRVRSMTPRSLVAIPLIAGALSLHAGPAASADIKVLTA